MPKEKLDEYSLVVVGSGGVGKSCLTVRFLKNEFMSEYDPTIEENYRKKITLDGGYECTVDIIDTAGQQEYKTLRDSHLRTGQGFLLVFALNDEGSFNELKELHEAIIRAKEESGTKVAFVVAGNKFDLSNERQVQSATGKAFADTLKAPYFETSAKTNDNVEQAFHAAVNEIRRLVGSQNGAKGGQSEKKKGGCILL